MNALNPRRYMAQRMIREMLAVAFVAFLLPAIAVAQQPTTQLTHQSEEQLDNGIVRRKVLFPGWDPYEPVPAYIYVKSPAENLPVVIFIHGMGANKNYLSNWHAQLAARGFAVISIDAHLSGDRRIATSIGGIKGEQNWVWPHQTVVNHTANDVAKILDVLPLHKEFDSTRVAVTGFSMGGATTMVLAWREPRISVVMPLCGCVDFWWDVTKIEPGPEQDARIAEFSPRLKQLTSSLDSNTPERMDAIVPKALFLINGQGRWHRHSLDSQVRGGNASTLQGSLRPVQVFRGRRGRTHFHKSHEGRGHPMAGATPHRKADPRAKRPRELRRLTSPSLGGDKSPGSGDRLAYAKTPGIGFALPTTPVSRS